MMLQACLCAEVALIQAAITKGFGKHILVIVFDNPRDITSIAIYYQASTTVAILAQNLSKMSFGVTLLKLIPGRWRYVCWFAIISLTMIAIPLAVIPWVQCIPFEKGFDNRIPGRCMDKSIPIGYGMFAATWAAIMDFALALMPWVLLWNVQMRMKEKIGVAIAMSLGLL